MIILGFILIILGILMNLDLSKITGFISKTKIGNLPGDIIYKKDNFTFYFPIVSSIVFSVFLTLILNILVKIFRKF